jgi:hypothetical protein
MLYGTSTPAPSSTVARTSGPWSEYLGHADPGFTLRGYTHLMRSSAERTRWAIDTVFGAPAPAGHLTDIQQVGDGSQR